MNILQLGPYPPPNGGVQTNLVAIQRYLHAHNMSSVAINLTRHRRENAEDVYYPRSALGVFRLLCQLRYDIAHLHVGGNLSFRLVALAVLCSLIPGKKVVLTLHSGGFPSSPAGLGLNRFKPRALALRRLDRVIAVNPEMVRFFEKCGVPSSRVRLIHPYPPVELREENRLTPELAAFFEAHDPVLVSVGGLEPEYDIPLQVDALGALRQTFPRAGLVIVGGGSLELELQKDVKHRPYGHDILLCGDVPHAVTLSAIRRAQVLLRTTLYDGDSIAIREALQLGTPVIATDNGMRPGGVTLIPTGSVARLKSAITKCLREPRQTAMAQSAGENNLQQVLRVYTELLEPRNAKSVCALPITSKKPLPINFEQGS